jgi:hypothetical protein
VTSKRTATSFAVLLGVLASHRAFSQGVPQGPEFRINTYTTHRQEWPSVAMDSSGNFVVVWQSYGQDGVAEGIFGQRYDSRGSLRGPEFRINTDTMYAERYPSVANDPSGNFMVVWQNGPGNPTLPPYDVFGRLYSSTGMPVGEAFRVNTYEAGSQHRPSVAADAAGNFVVVWRGEHFDGPGVFGQRYDPAGVASGPQFRVGHTAVVGSPAVAADANGNFVVVWPEGSGYSSSIFGQRYASSGAPLGTEFRVNEITTTSQSFAKVAADSQGNIVVAWAGVGQDGSDYGVLARRYDSSGAPSGPEFVVNTYTTGIQSGPSVASDASGNFFVAWQSDGQDGSNWGVYGQLYDSSGTAFGGEFRISTAVENFQGLPAAQLDASGNVLAVWAAAGQDGDNLGIYGQRYIWTVPIELMDLTVE